MERSLVLTILVARYPPMDSSPLVAEARFQLAKAHQCADRLDAALQEYALARQQYDRTSDELNLLKVDNNVAMIYLSRRDYDHARHYFNLSELSATELGDQLGIARAALNLTTVEKADRSTSGGSSKGTRSEGAFELVKNEVGIAAALIKSATHMSCYTICGTPYIT